MITQREDNPQVIAPVTDERNQTKFETEYRKGHFFRCWPKTAKEIFLIQMLEHRKEKFAPASGCGIIIPLEAYRKFFAPI
jgi:hypothetical protein